VIGDSVTSIGDYAFYSCSNLTSIEVDEDNQHYMSIDGNLYSKDGEILIQYAIGKEDESFEIPSGVTVIGNYAFYDCDNLISVVIPDSVIIISEHAFYSCYSLTSVIIGNGVSGIGYEAFANCGSLTDVVIGNSVSYIESNAFYDCYYLTNVYCYGTEYDWYRIDIESDNYYLENAKRYYYSEYDQYVYDKYWHYNENGEIEIWR
jgi:hypothetical protein